MRRTILLLSFLIFSNIIFAQNSNINYPGTIITPPPGFRVSGTSSSVITINGFDNFYLGNDFGEPYIAVNPSDPKRQVCAYNTNSFYYTLNGTDWTRSYPTFPGYNILGDPVMTFDNLGNVFYVSLYSPNLASGPWGIVIARSTDNGASWSNYYKAHETTLQLADKEWVAADLTNGPYSNYLYIGWRQYGTTGMGFMRSTNHGVNWSTPLNLTGGQGAYVSVGPNGSIQGGYVYFACSNDYGGNAIYMHRSSDGGETFQFLGNVVSGISAPGVPYGVYGRPTLKSTHIRVDNMPRMAVDNGYTSTRGNVYIVYATNPPGPDLADIQFVKSTDNGVTWSAPIKLNDDATTTDQWMPTISTDNTGKIFVSWYDSRNDPINNTMSDIYGTTSSNGGNTFAPDSRISNASFNPDNMAIVNAVDASYIGDYFGTASTGNGITSVTAWMDNRTEVPSTLQSFVGYNPDFAMTINPSQKYLGNNDSAIIAVNVPGIKGIFLDRVKFSASADSLPLSGNLQFSFINGRDSITSFPDSVYLRVKTIGSITPGIYRITITGSGKNGTPVHRRKANLYINASNVIVQTNRDGIAIFKVNGVPYTTRQNFVFPNGTVINVQAVSPIETTGSKYIYQSWSDWGDTTHNVTINGPLLLTATYKVQFKLIMNSSIPFTFGGNQFHDSAVSFQFGVTSRIVNYNGTVYTFKGWDGTGNGSYTSPDSSGLDTTINIALSNPVVEEARWYTPVYISNTGNTIPKEFGLSQNYPNPFNPRTKINFALPFESSVRITVYDMLGREIKSLIHDESIKAGYYTVELDVTNLASGIYYYTMTANGRDRDYIFTKKMVVLK